MQDSHFSILILCQFVDPSDANFGHITRYLYWSCPCLIISRKLVIKLCLPQNCKGIFFMILSFLKNISCGLRVKEDEHHSLSEDQRRQGGCLACSYASLWSLRMQLSGLCRLRPLKLLVFIHSIEL
jgi:hypothetical protein